MSEASEDSASQSTSQTASQTLTLQATTQKLVIWFRPTGNAPVLKQSKFKISADHSFQAVVDFLRRQLKLANDADPVTGERVGLAGHLPDLGSALQRSPVGPRMSSIDKLLIRGIRSFSPYNENVIEFYAPLTIIVGHNGAGKTTIIECLKYATTGDLPPNSKGGAFVHDPKVSREAEVKGQIKLKFKNVKGQTMVVTRSMQSTQKRSKLEQKTLESLLVTNDPATGEQVSISSRCAEMDSEIPLQLGVSRAVLENVIFCHQEESFWPLSEPSLLKKKFDDIFAATRYTRALDTLKAIKKDLTNELKLELQKLEYLRADKDKASKIQLEIEKSERRCDQGQENIVAIDSKMRSIKQSIDGLTRELQSLGDLQAELERLEHDIKSTQRSQDDIGGGMQVMVEGGDQLQLMLEQLGRRTTHDAEAFHKYQERKRSIECMISDESKQFSKLSTKMGVLEAELGRIDDRKSSLLQLLLNLQTRMNLSSHDDPSQLLQAGRRRVAEQTFALQKLQDEVAQQQATFNQKLQAVVVQSSTLSESKRTKRKGIEEAQRRLATTLDQLNEVTSSKDRIADLQVRLLEDEASLNELKDFLAAANYEARLEALNLQRKRFDQEIQEINNRIASSARHSDIRAKSELKRSELQKKRELVAKLYGEIQFDLDSAAGFSVPIGDAEKESDRLWRLKERQLKAHQERSSKALQNLIIAGSKYEQAQTVLKSKQRELAEKEKKLQQTCGGEDFDIYFEESENELARVSTELASSLSSKATYEAFIKTFGQSRTCPLCERPFNAKTDEELFGQKLGQFIESLPGKTVELQGTKRRMEARLAELKGLRSVNDDVDRLRLVELPGLEDEIKSLEGEKDRAQSALDDLNCEVTSVTLEEKKVSALKKRCEELGKLNRDYEALKTDVERIEKDITLVGAELDMGDAEEKLKSARHKREEALQTIETTSEEAKSRQHELQSRESRYHETKEHLMKIQLKQSEVVVMEQTKKDLEFQINSMQKEMSEFEKQALLLSREETTLKEEIAGWKRQSDSMLKTTSETLKSQEELVRECSTVEAEIDRLRSSCNEDMLSTTKNARETVSGKLGSLQAELDMINDQISAFSKVKSEAIVQERNIRDNLKFRELGLRVQELEERAKTLLAQVKGFDRTAASVELQRQELRHSELLGERSAIFGELRQLQDQMGRLKNELETDYCTTEGDYRNQFIKYNATATAIEDLEKYAKALDQAIMKFHSYQMNEVNRIIREIWTTTYQGADIDTIEIRADHESAVGGRSYNYRVVMVKGETELDMRGRSSAGQRVLASLVIRLALAETFGQHCGILALDEPTTNLDRENIDSLANSLAEIIKMRGRQGNFQLVIITHDEEFVELLGRHECADYYWRVFKDESQYSAIERQSFQGL